MIAREGLRVEVTVSEAALPECEWVFREPVTGRLRLEHDGGLLSLTGRFQTLLEAPCRRCLRPVSLGLEFPVEERFLIERVESPAAPPEEGEELDDVLPTLVSLQRSGPVLDVTELLRQALELHAPPAPVCQEECAGLCAHCGADLNEGPCDCLEEAPHPALAGLAALLPESGD